MITSKYIQMKKILFVFILLAGFLVRSQEKPSINSFKYVVVPIKLDFLKQQDQYQTSSLAKFLFEKSGFKVYLSNEVFPKDLSMNRCLALTANIQKSPGFLTKKIHIELLDCRNNLIYKTEISTTREKNYTKAYREVLRDVFKSIQALNYKYKPEVSQTITVEPEKQVVKEKKVVETKSVVQKDAQVNDKVEEISQLTAKFINTGYNLFNANSKIVYKVLKTNVKEVFIIKDMNGVLYKDKNFWIAEYYTPNNELVKKKYAITF